MLARAHIIISGLVQGVSFRWFTQSEARRRGIGGWVRNIGNSQVEVLAEGEKDDILDLVQTFEHRHPFARVDKVDISWDKCQN